MLSSFTTTQRTCFRAGALPSWHAVQKNTQIYEQLRDWGVNTFITGVTNPEVPWVGAIHEAAKASAVNLLGGTHYSTEKFAPMQMCRYFEAFGLPSEFLPETPRMTEL